MTTQTQTAAKKVRTANAHWEGNLREGKGTVSTASGVLKSTPYSFAQRFEDAAGTNPEELIGAAHAGCFSMALSGQLTKAGHAPKSIDTTAEVRLVQGDGKWTIEEVHLKLQAEVPGISEADFQRLANDAKEGCPVSRALKATKITLDARLQK